MPGRPPPPRRHEPAPGIVAPRADQPLRGGAKFLLVLSAALAIAVFYLFVVGAMVVLLVFLAAELIAFVALLRFGFARFLTPFLQRHSQLLMLFLRSAWIPSRVDFRVPITASDAPPLFDFLRELSRRMKVPAPREVLVEMNAGAWVRLHGLRRGASATTLGLGYDLIAALTEREIEAVMAHEMAHAKFVRRGLKRLLNGGLTRSARLAGALSDQVEVYRRAHQSFELAQGLLAIAHRWARLCARLVAAYSRQDEFEADLGAAEICGSGPLRSSLLKLERMGRNGPHWAGTNASPNSNAATDSAVGWRRNYRRRKRAPSPPRRTYSTPTPPTPPCTTGSRRCRRIPTAGAEPPRHRTPRPARCAGRAPGRRDSPRGAVGGTPRRS